jgi:hypothetical protein
VRIALLVFGAFNIAFPAPGTAWIRALGAAYTLAALLTPDEIAGGMLVIALFFWPPAFMVAWALAREDEAARRSGPVDQEWSARRARRALAAIIGAVAAASWAYHVIVGRGLGQTGALFIGLPTLLAIFVVVAVSPRSATGVACKATTVGLLVSMIFLWEGALCVVMSAPLFYAVSISIASAMDAVRRRGDKATTTLASCIVVLVAGPMSLEGVAPSTTLNRAESVTEVRIVRASSSDVERALLEPPRFERGQPRPLFLRAGFPTPVASRIERATDRTRWVIEMRGGEMLLNGMEARTGDLVLDLQEARPGLVRWRAVSDSSHMTHFLTFRESVVEWTPVDAQTTKVTWTLRYRRDLDPVWYFGPMERYAVRLAAGYLIDAVATP